MNFGKGELANKRILRFVARMIPGATGAELHPDGTIFVQINGDFFDLRTLTGDESRLLSPSCRCISEPSKTENPST